MSRNTNRISHKLVDVTLRELGIALDKEQQVSEWAGDLTPEMLSYASKDSEVLLPLTEALEARIEDAGLQRVADIERRALPALVWMSTAGVPFDPEGWEKHMREIEGERDKLNAELAALAPDHPEDRTWNWNSVPQLLQVFGLLGMRLSDTKEETLSRCDHPFARVLLEYRRASKLLGTYGPKLLEKVEGGRIYGSWWQVGAGTGRMACSSPNLQNFPPAVRRYVRAPKGRALVVADYSQIELRVAAKISGDETMLKAFAEDKDIHEITARSLTGREKVSKAERKLAKAVNFGLLYGMSPGGLRAYARASYGVEMTHEEAERYWQGFFETYPGLRTWHDREYRALRQGCIETRTMTGRRRTGITKLTERLNSPVQGTGADGLKLALALLYEQRSECPRAVPILTVHDEVVVECDKADAEKARSSLVEVMIEGMDEVLNDPQSGEPRVPVKVEAEILQSWAA